MQQLDLQFYTFFVMILAGMAGGLLFDLSRAIRWEFHAGRILTGLIDLIFWVLATLVVAAALVIGNWGVIRLYVPVGLAFGLALYTYLAGRIAMTVFRFLLRMLRRVLRSIWEVIAKVFLEPILELGGALKRPVGHLLAPVTRGVTALRARLARWLGPKPPLE